MSQAHSISFQYVQSNLMNLISNIYKKPQQFRTSDGIKLDLYLPNVKFQLLYFQRSEILRVIAAQNCDNNTRKRDDDYQQGLKLSAKNQIRLKFFIKLLSQFRVSKIQSSITMTEDNDYLILRGKLTMFLTKIVKNLDDIYTEYQTDFIFENNVNGFIFGYQFQTTLVQIKNIANFIKSTIATDPISPNQYSQKIKEYWTPLHYLNMMFPTVQKIQDVVEEIQDYFQSIMLKNEGIFSKMVESCYSYLNGSGNPCQTQSILYILHEKYKERVFKFVDIQLKQLFQTATAQAVEIGSHESSQQYTRQILKTIGDCDTKKILRNMSPQATRRGYYRKILTFIQSQKENGQKYLLNIKHQCNYQPRIPFLNKQKLKQKMDLPQQYILENKGIDIILEMQSLFENIFRNINSKENQDKSGQESYQLLSNQSQFGIRDSVSNLENYRDSIFVEIDQKDWDSDENVRIRPYNYEYRQQQNEQIDRQETKVVSKHRNKQAFPIRIFLSLIKLMKSYKKNGFKYRRQDDKMREKRSGIGESNQWSHQ